MKKWLMSNKSTWRRRIMSSRSITSQLISPQIQRKPSKSVPTLRLAWLAKNMKLSPSRIWPISKKDQTKENNSWSLLIEAVPWVELHSILPGKGRWILLKHCFQMVIRKTIFLSMYTSTIIMIASSVKQTSSPRKSIPTLLCLMGNLEELISMCVTKKWSSILIPDKMAMTISVFSWQMVKMAEVVVTT